MSIKLTLEKKLSITLLLLSDLSLPERELRVVEQPFEPLNTRRTTKIGSQNKQCNNTVVFGEFTTIQKSCKKFVF
jgi:hypothetical protein